METPEVDAGLHLPMRQRGRDLLFGDQVRESERQLNRLEERLVKGHTDLKEDTRRRFESP